MEADCGVGIVGMRGGRGFVVCCLFVGKKCMKVRGEDKDGRNG